MMTRTLILALSLTVTALPAAAQTEVKTAAVQTGDLDLTNAADLQRLDTRLNSAARSVCRTGVRGVAERTRQAECVAATLARTTPQAERAIAGAQGKTQLALLMAHAPR